MNCRLLLWFLGLSSIVSMLSFGADIQSENRPAEVIPLAPDIQQEIVRVVTALSAGDMPEEAVWKIVRDFKGFKNKPPEELLLQVLAVYGGKDEYRTNPQAEKAKRLLFSSLLQEMTPSNIVLAVAPKYEQASDPKLEYSLRQALGMATLRGGRVDVMNPNFDAFSAYIAQRKEQPPGKLVGFMYGHNPQAAVLSMARVYGDKAVETELAEQLKGDPKAMLQSLATRPEWWVRLYVVEMLKKNPQLHDKAVLKKLEQDADPLVREQADKVLSGRGNRGESLEN
ncbi:MAG: hypothetical protein ACOX5G_00700 [Kiritimatiellia bacterium]|jgi:hypothetical protein